MIASCGFLEDELRQCSKEEGVTMADSVETLGIDLRVRVKNLGVKEKARRKKCKVIFSPIKKNKAFQKNYMKVEVKKLLRAVMVQARTWGVHAVRLPCPFSWRLLVVRWRKISLLWPPSIGRKGYGLENGQLNKKKLG